MNNNTWPPIPNIYEDIKDVIAVQLHQLHMFDIFISTYTEYESICKKMTKNYILIDRNDTDIKNIKKPNILQWFHLDIFSKNTRIHS